MSNKNIFSLHRLPDKARLHVIKSFYIPTMIAFSLISTKTKSLAQSFNMKIISADVSIVDNSLTFDVYYDDLEKSTFEIYDDVVHSNPEDPLISLDQIPDHIKTQSNLDDYPYTTFTWSKPGFSFKNWFHHVLSLFKCNDFNIFFEAEHEIFDTVAIRNLLPEWTFIDLFDASTDYSSKILDIFTQCVIHLEARYVTLLEFPQKVAIQNFRCLDVSKPLTLDDLLISNAFEAIVSEFSLSDVNRFFKCWIRGSNPRLKKIKIYLRENMSEEKLLKGMKYQSVVVEGMERNIDNQGEDMDDDAAGDNDAEGDDANNGSDSDDDLDDEDDAEDRNDDDVGESEENDVQEGGDVSDIVDEGEAVGEDNEHGDDNDDDDDDDDQEEEDVVDFENDNDNEYGHNFEVRKEIVITKSGGISAKVVLVGRRPRVSYITMYVWD